MDKLKIVSQKKSRDTVTRTIRINGVSFDKINELAEEYDLSFNAVINQVIEYANKSNRLDDIIVIDLSGNFKYNPLDKPDLKPIVLANRLKTILTLFSPNNSESYWLDKV